MHQKKKKERNKFSVLGYIRWDTRREIDDTFKKLATCGSVKDLFPVLWAGESTRDVETHGV